MNGPLPVGRTLCIMCGAKVDAPAAKVCAFSWCHPPVRLRVKSAPRLARCRCGDEQGHDASMEVPRRDEAGCSESGGLENEPGLRNDLQNNVLIET